MLREIDTFFDNKEEPVKGYLIFLREHNQKQDPHNTETWKYEMPFYCYKGKCFATYGFTKRMDCPISV
jgi:hypothetical protein